MRLRESSWLGRLQVGLVVVLLAVVLAVAGVDLVLRWRAHRAADEHVTRLLAGGRSSIIDTGPGELAPGIRASPVPNLVYEPKANLRGVYDGAPVATNRVGARHDYELPLERAGGEFRLVGIGGDRAWGRGVSNGETYLDRLQEKLGRLAPGRAHVVNLGVWGYNATQQVAALRAKGTILRPDVVVIDLHGDDLLVPTRLARLAYRPPGGSYLLAAILGLWRDTEADSGAEPQVRYADFELAYNELATLAVERRFAVVVFSDCLLESPREALPRHCQRFSSGEWQRWLHRTETHRGFGVCPFNGELIGKQPPPWQTPSADGHRVLADLLYDCLIANPLTHPGLVPQAVIRLPVTNPGLWLAGFSAVEPDGDRAVARGREGLALGVRWLEPGERYFVELELDAAPGGLALAAEDSEPEPLVAAAGGLLRSAAPFEVDQGGELRLVLAADGEVGLRAVLLTRAPR